jgi:hypothetical protein
VPDLAPPLSTPARAKIVALLALLALLPGSRPAAAQAPTQDLAPPAVLARPAAKPPAHPSVTPVKPAPRLAMAPAPAPRLALAPSPAPMRGPPPAPAVFPDRGRQLIELQTASRVGPPPRPLNPLESAAMWKGYTARIGRPPNLGGGGGSGGGGGGATP